MQETQETQVPSLGQEDPPGRERQLTPVFLPGKSYEQRSLGPGVSTVHRVKKSRTQLSMHAYPLSLSRTASLSTLRKGLTLDGGWGRSSEGVVCWYIFIELLPCPRHHEGRMQRKVGQYGNE